jgi:uncharacterized protein DUF3253
VAAFLEVMATSDKDAILKKYLDELLDSREYPKTICPSEVARQCTSSELEQCGVQNWRDVMQDIRDIAWKQRDGGQLDILQKGNMLDPELSRDDIKGPIRLRRRPKETDLKT